MNLETDFGWFLRGLADFYVEPDQLEHHGVKGQKWGVRRDRASKLEGMGPSKVEVKTSSGDKLTLEKNAPTKLHKAMALASDKYAKSYGTAAYLSIKDKDGNKVGDANLWKNGKDELYLNWISIKPGARGNGYATAALKAAESYGSQQGFKRMVLDVPAKSPDARHIYEKLGFKVTNEVIDPNDTLWGGLTTMQYDFGTVKHGEMTIDDFIGHYFGVPEEEMPIDEFFAHYGIKGMHWGVRKDGQPGSSKGPANSSKAALTDPRHLSDADLRAAVQRMQLERQFSQLQQERVKEGGDFAKQMLKEIGKTQVRRVASKAADIAVEQAIAAVGRKAGVPGLGELSKRMKPKKK